ALRARDDRRSGGVDVLRGHASRARRVARGLGGGDRLLDRRVALDRDERGLPGRSASSEERMISSAIEAERANLYAMIGDLLCEVPNERTIAGMITALEADRAP